MSKRKSNTPPPSGHACAVSGCPHGGEFKAPKSRDALHDYQWLCLEHVREFNQSWNYFKGMETDEIESFMHDSLTGHRPTWEREQHIRRNGQDYTNRLDEGMRRFFNWDEASMRKAALESLPARERRALATLELSAPVSAKQLKAHFRALVKRTHPDLHPGDKDVEEKFKTINIAYHYLLKQYDAK
jgi:hypothetical protein